MNEIIIKNGYYTDREKLHWSDLHLTDIQNKFLTIINLDKFFHINGNSDDAFEYYYIENVMNLSSDNEMIMFHGRKALPSQLLSKKSNLFSISKKYIVQIDSFELSIWQTYVPKFSVTSNWLHNNDLSERYHELQELIINASKQQLG